MTTNTINQAITKDRLRTLAPSVFAMEHKPGLSQRYTFVPTIEIVKDLEREGWLPVKAQEMRTVNAENQGFQKHLIRFRNFNEQMMDKLEVGDTFIEMVLTNSHNGRSAFIFNCGMYRLACSNGMVVSQNAFDAIHIRHSGYDTSEVLKVSNEVITKAPDVVNAVRNFQSIELTQPEKLAFGKAAKRLRFENPDVVETERILLPNRRADTGSDLWKTFNTVQENLVKGHVSYYDTDEQGHRKIKTTREVKAIDSNMKLNQALYTLAEEMAKIKGNQAQ